MGLIDPRVICVVNLSAYRRNSPKNAVASSIGVPLAPIYNCCFIESTEGDTTLNIKGRVPFSSLHLSHILPSTTFAGEHVTGI